MVWYSNVPVPVLPAAGSTTGGGGGTNYLLLLLLLLPTWGTGTVPGTST